MQSFNYFNFCQAEMTTEKLIPMGLKAKDVGKEPFRVTLSIADLPGIVEGASLDRFNGLAALKHLEYSEIILMVVDLHGFRLSPNEPVKSVAIYANNQIIYSLF